MPAASEMVALVAAVVVVLVFTIVGGVIGARAYQLNQDEIAEITDVNIRNAVTNASIKSFEALETNAEFQSLIVLGVAAGIVLAAIFGAFAMQGRGGYGGGYGM